MKEEIIHAWINKALESPLHAKIYIPMVSKIDAKEQLRAFKKEQKVLYKTDPEKASTLLISSTFKDSHHWVIIERVVGNALVGFIKNPDGSTDRVTLDLDIERERRIEAMRKDGFSEEEIQEMEGKICLNKDLKEQE